MTKSDRTPRVGVLERATELLFSLVPDLDESTIGYESARRDRAREACGIALDPPVSPTRRHLWDIHSELATGALRRNLVEAAAGHVDEAWLDLAERIASGRPRPAMTAAGTEGPSTAALDVVEWFVIRAALGQRGALERVEAELRPLLDPESAQLLDLDLHLFRGEWALAGEVARDVAARPSGLVPSPPLLAVAAMTDFIVGDTVRGVEDLLRLDRTGGARMAGFTAFAIARHLALLGRTAEAIEILCSLGDRDFPNEDPDDVWMTKGVLRAAGVARGLLERTSPPTRPELLATLRDADPLLDWEPLAFLWAAVGVETIGREAAFVELEQEANRALASWEREQRRETACTIGQFFLEEDDPARARAWFRRGASEALREDELAHWLDAIRQQVEQLAGAEAAEALVLELRDAVGERAETRTTDD